MIERIKKMNINDSETIILMLSIDCFLFGFFSALTTNIYFKYLEFDFTLYNQYFIAICIVSIHVLCCYNYALTRYTIYSNKIITFELKKNKLI